MLAWIDANPDLISGAIALVMLVAAGVVFIAAAGSALRGKP